MDMLDDNSIIDELKIISDDLRKSEKYRQANMVDMAITKISHCHVNELEQKNKLIEELKIKILRCPDCEKYMEIGTNFENELHKQDKVLEELKQQKECIFKRTDSDCEIYTCSNCKEDYIFEYEPNEFKTDNYCSSCGARITEFIDLEESVEVQDI